MMQSISQCDLIAERERDTLQVLNHWIRNLFVFETYKYIEIYHSLLMRSKATFEILKLPHKIVNLHFLVVLFVVTIHFLVALFVSTLHFSCALLHKNCRNPCEIQKKALPLRRETI